MADASTEEALRFRFIDGISQHFNIQKWGIYLANEEQHLADYDVVGVSDAFVERYDAIGRSVDPVLSYVLKHHAPAHEELVLPGGGWKRSDLYQRCCSEYDHEHIMTGPIVGNGKLIGTIHFARVHDTPVFNAQELSSFGAVCAHLSACLATLRAQTITPSALLCQRLTSREMQIVNLVSKGLTNEQVGRELWITQNSVKQALKRIFHKIEVSSRVELVAKLGITYEPE
jgi:DNA-binding CsgD family transcriptional regulator